jgi:hypothetical protein
MTASTEIDWLFRPFKDTIAGDNIFFSEGAGNEFNALRIFKKRKMKPRTPTRGNLRERSASSRIGIRKAGT